jgi:hypothetical protein
MSALSDAINALDPEGYWELNESLNALDDRGTGGATLSTGGNFTLGDNNVEELAVDDGHPSTFRGSGSGGLTSPDAYAFASTDGSRYSPAQDFSLFLRARPVSFPGSQDLAALVNKSGSFGIYLDHNGAPHGYVQEGNSRTIADGPGLASDDDVSLALTYDGSDVKLYVNGSLEDTTSGGPGDINQNSSGLVVGSWDTSVYGALADIAHVALFPVVLTDQQVSDLHDAATVTS